MSRQKLSHYRLLTADMGQLLPCGLVEVLPGDQFRHSSSCMIRLSPLAAPIMHPVNVRLHHFFVPRRLTWRQDNGTFEDFITGGPDGNDAQTVPVITTTGVEKDLLDYLGLPTKAGIEVAADPLRAVNLVYNEFYRDQDLVTERELEDTTVPYIAWEKDYHTTARPWPQKGDDVTLPVGTKAPIKGLGKSNQTGIQGQGSYYETDGGGTPRVYENSVQLDTSSGYEWDLNTGEPSIWADLSAATAAKVNDIRRAFALQRYAENRARYGSRYPEYLKTAFGVRSSDARLQRPEYLGGGTARVSISEVLQTANETTSERFGVGDMYGHGVSFNRSNAYRRRFTEHGYVLSFVSCRPKQMFSNGVERTFLRRDREDFFQRELQFIGQQEVLQQEVYADGTNKDVVFGWSDRYDEYRRQRSLVTAEFRSSLDYWHLARQFATPPVLNQSFIECVPSKRIFNEQTANSLWIAVNHRLVARRRIAREAVGRAF